MPLNATVGGETTSGRAGLKMRVYRHRCTDEPDIVSSGTPVMAVFVAFVGREDGRSRRRSSRNAFIVTRLACAISTSISGSQPPRLSWATSAAIPGDERFARLYERSGALPAGTPGR